MPIPRHYIATSWFSIWTARAFYPPMRQKSNYETIVYIIYCSLLHVSLARNEKNNKATGWLAALVRVTNLKLRFSRLRDKMLVFVGLVKKNLQHGHSFRLAGVWLKCQNLCFACAVNRFCSSRATNIGNLWFSLIFSYPMQTSTHASMPFLFSKSQCQSAFGNAMATDSNKANQGDIMTPCPTC